MDKPRKPHYAMSLRLKPAMGELLETLSAKLSVDKTTVLVLALQDFAKARNVPIPEGEPVNAE